ncbi:hypothetical protein [Flammeovirga sp. SJP92]|uniref:hypothetical protein n=1 Tax=Flammeovirga sp. SJP92 TaxID=1775430 RepID=UPI000788770D|nr:hypothetical protein [Flammeovirga sp. SJP92]KXX72745.1 hypothetical protein AVL50_32105 [Flammeovirga sp. SJP92]
MSLREYCKKNNLHKGYDIVLSKLRENENERIMKDSLSWSKIGRVTSSFYEVTKKKSYSIEDTIEAIVQLGIPFSELQNPKWYKFWVDKDIFKVKEAIRILSK